MGFLAKLLVWQRLLLLIAVPLGGLVALGTFSFVGLNTVEKETQEVFEQLPAMRYSQRITIRALQIRSHLLLALQHNPDRPEIAQLHGHPTSLHLSEARRLVAELEEIQALIHRDSPASELEWADSLRQLEAVTREFVEVGVKPVIALYESGSGEYFNANIHLLKLTNPTFERLQKTASAFSDAILASAEAEHATMDASFNRTEWVSVGISLAIGVVCVALGAAIVRSIVRQIGGEPTHAAVAAARIAEGDLSRDIEAKGAVPGSLMASMAAMQERLREMMTGIHVLVSDLAHHAGQLSAGAQEIRQASGEQSSATSTTAASVEEMTVSINEVSQIAATTEQSSTATAEFAAKGRQLVAASVDEIERVLQTVARSSARIRELESRSKEIGGIANVIREIAEQTNLLALNAAIEAARAGEQGRGFAMVADEVRRLAERTAQATSEIGRMIVGVLENTTQAVGSMEEAMPQVRGGLDMAREAREMLESIHREARQTQARIHEVATATREQATAANSIARLIERIAAMTEATYTTVGSNAASAAQLERMADELRQAIGHFRIS